MQYVSIKNIERYHPGYADRSLIWCKVHFSMLNSDPEFEMLCEIDKWRFVAILILQLQTKKPVPIDQDYLSRKGFDYKKRDISLTLQMLHNFLTCVTEDENPCYALSENHVTQSRVEYIKKSRVDIEGENYAAFEQAAFSGWNLLCEKIPALSKLNHITESRRKLLKRRFGQETFRGIDLLFEKIAAQKFLHGDNDRGWKISFDWLIKNDINHIKVLEGKYGINGPEIPEYLRSVIK